MILVKNHLATEHASSSHQIQWDKWAKKEETYQHKERNLEEQLQTAIVKKDRLAAKTTTSLLRVQQYEHQISEVEWQSACKDTEIHFLWGTLATYTQLMQKLQEERGSATQWATEANQRGKDYKFQLAQCFTPLEGLKDIPLKLSQCTQEGMVELGFTLGVLEKHIINLSQLCQKAS